MREMRCDVAVIGGGPAGLAAALEAARGGASVVVVERNHELGGILQQCVHDGFGLQRTGRSLTGPGYAQLFIDEVEKNPKVEVLLDSMVLEVSPDRVVWACNPKDGMVRLECGAIVLAMGCRERTAQQVLLQGYRPQGVLTAGAAQRYINVEGYLPGSRAVILGSGDIGLIMARRMTLEGIEVEGVYEVMPHPGGLARNVTQCLDDFGIPLHLSHGVTRVHGKHHLEGVTVAELDEARGPIPGTERDVECDLLVLAVGLIPENELSRTAGIEIDPVTRGPVLDQDLMTSVPGIFAAGNVSIVFDLVDYVSASGERAARGALSFIAGNMSDEPTYRDVEKGGMVGACIPQRVRLDGDAPAGDTSFFLRVTRPMSDVAVTVASSGEKVVRRRLSAVTPTTMVSVDATLPANCEPTIEISEAR